MDPHACRREGDIHGHPRGGAGGGDETHLAYMPAPSADATASTRGGCTGEVGGSWCLYTWPRSPPTYIHTRRTTRRVQAEGARAT